MSESNHDRIEGLYNRLPWNDDWGPQPPHVWRPLPKVKLVSPPAESGGAGTRGGGDAMPDLIPRSQCVDLYH